MERFFGGSPAAVILQLAIASIIIGVVLTFFGFDPANLVTTRFLGSGTGYLRWAWTRSKRCCAISLLGAIIVVPLWLLSRIFSYFWPRPPKVGLSGLAGPAGRKPGDVTSRDVLAIAIPMIVSNATVPLVGIADTAVVGQLNDPALIGGVALGSTIFSMLFWAFGFLRMGTTGLTAQAAGAGNRAEIAANLYRPLVIALGRRGAPLPPACARDPAGAPAHRRKLRGADGHRCLFRRSHPQRARHACQLRTRWLAHRPDAGEPRAIAPAFPERGQHRAGNRPCAFRAQGRRRCCDGGSLRRICGLGRGPRHRREPLARNAGHAHPDFRAASLRPAHRCQCGHHDPHHLPDVRLHLFRGAGCEARRRRAGGEQRASKPLRPFGLCARRLRFRRRGAGGAGGGRGEPAALPAGGFAKLGLGGRPGVWLWLRCSGREGSP